ncbi:MAG: phage portal protein [Humidesulfovibrio sp.]
MRRRYAAAQMGRLVGDWFPVGTDVNALVTNAAPLVRERTRQLVRDFPAFARAANALTTYVVGAGIQFQSRALGPDNKPHKIFRTRIEDALKHWMDDADVSGSAAFSQHFFELQALAKRQDVEQGECFAVFQPHHTGRKAYLDFGITLYESERLASLNVKPLHGNLVHGGIEYDARTGSPLAFHFVENTLIYKTVRVPAEDVVFGLDRRRPAQMRGITPFAPALMLARDLAMTMDAEIDAAKLASKWLAVVTTPDPASAQAGVQTVDGKPIEMLENAIIEYLNPGESIDIQSHQRGGESFQGFCKFIMRLIAITADIPYEILSGDYNGMGYISLRVGRNDFAQQLAPIQSRHVRHFCQPIFRKVLDRAVLQGRLDLPGYWTNPWGFQRGVWICPGMKEVDPLREVKSAIERIRAGLGSPQEYIMERGGDPDQVLSDIAAWKQACAEMGLDFNAMLGSVKTAMANNPAAISPDDKSALDPPDNADDPTADAATEELQ